MFQVLLYACIVKAAVSIIVTDPPPTSTEYNYWYDIVDPSTVDAKSLHELRQGDNVKGTYSIIDPDRMKRVVYVACKHGFKATVRKDSINLNQFKPRNYNPLIIRNSGGNGYIYPVPYLRNVQVPIFSTNNFIPSGEPNYFTPGNDTSSENVKFNDGEYFLPNYFHH